MSKIQNKTQLIENTQKPLIQKARELVLQSMENAINATDPKHLLNTTLTLEGQKLTIGQLSFELNQFRKIYVIGGGKATGAMAEAIEETLKNRIKAGYVNVPYGNNQKTQIIKINETSHPIPDQAGLEGTQQMITLAEQANEDDLVICLISGGGSSLMPLPRSDITLEDKRSITDALLKSGAAIYEINTVRKHISAFKGGWLAKAAYPATLVNLILSDVIGDPLDAIASGPTVPDHTNFTDAKKILEKYGLWSNSPKSVRNVINDGIKGKIAETPKPNDPIFKKVNNVIIGNNQTASLAAYEYLKKAGMNTLLLSRPLEGEAKQAGINLVSIALKISSLNRPMNKPTAIIAGGETTVTVNGKGKGGRNQELALSAALKLKGIENCALASMSTDGIDGPTDAAGAIVDGDTIVEAEKNRLNAKEYLANNDSYRFFERLGGLIFTGATGTNVNDISVIIIL